MAGSFDFSLADSQGTEVVPVAPEQFPFEEYLAYTESLESRCSDFMQKKRNSLVYRRFRVPAVFADASADMQVSLELQLGGLAASMRFATDIPNFLEPWYGIGTVASAFGCTYAWHPGQAPATTAPFSSFKAALASDPVAIEKTPVGKYTIEMLEYFLEKTRGMVPVSLCDVQSPLNASGYLVDTNNYYLGLYDDPESFKELLERIVDLSIPFYRKLQDMTGTALVSPGHGFASSRVFAGFGMSDDNITMLSPDLYRELVLPSVNRLGTAMGGTVFHSCGNWADKLPVVREMAGLLCVDGAFSAETDPDPNSPEPFIANLSGSDVILNARLVGRPDSIGDRLSELADSSVRTILVTYGRTPEEQQALYERASRQ